MRTWIETKAKAVHDMHCCTDETRVDDDHLRVAMSQGNKRRNTQLEGPFPAQMTSS